MPDLTAGLSPEERRELERRLLHYAACSRGQTILGSTTQADLDKAFGAIVAFVESIRERDRADAERLDWLERERLTVEARKTEFAIWRDDREGEAADFLSSATTLRGAIDAARSADDQPANG